jgi:probable rRNA maturation factor
MPDPGDSPQSAETPSLLALDIVHDAGSWQGFGRLEDGIARAGRALAAHAAFRGLKPCEACIALSDDAGVRRLNAAYRNKDKPTNVLSFPAAPAGQRGRARFLGDVVLAEETLLREAAEQGKPPAHHVQHLVVHGILHLLGYDHETEKDAEVMERLETDILAAIGIDDPYGTSLDPARHETKAR